VKGGHMKSNRSFWTPAVLSAAAVVAGASLWIGGAPPASALVPTLSSAAAGSVSGSVIGSPETVSFSGSVAIASKRVSDPDFGSGDIVVLSIDLSGMKGTGQSSKATYVVSNQEIIQRPLTAADNIVVTFPFAKSGSSMSMSPRIGAASLALSFDVTTGALTAAKVTVSNP
jgi:hypothetical protein